MTKIHKNCTYKVNNLTTNLLPDLLFIPMSVISLACDIIGLFLVLGTLYDVKSESLLILYNYYLEQLLTC